MPEPLPAAAGIAEEGAPGSQPNADALFGRLRWLRARAQSLQELAQELQRYAPASSAHTAARDREQHAALDESSPIITRNCLQITAVMEEISALLERSPKLYSAWGDVVARVQEAWEEASAEWTRLGEAAAMDRSRHLAAIVKALDSLIYDCGLATIPSRILSHLELLPFGGVLDFPSSYADELPTAEQRQRFLRYLANYPGLLYGLIDVENERIYRASPKAWRRGLTLPLTVALALAGFGLIYAACYLGDARHLTDWPFNGQRRGEQLAAYGFLLLGSLAHVAVNLLKQDRSASRSTQALADWMLRIHVRETSYYASAFWLSLGGIAMAFLFKDRVDWKTAFVIGYSYDSFLDLFLQRFEKMAASSQASIKKAASASAPRARRREG